MQHYLYMNFYIVEGVVGLRSIGAIVANCINDIQRSVKHSKELATAIERSHRLDAEELNRAEVEKKIKAMQERMSKREGRKIYG